MEAAEDIFDKWMGSAIQPEDEEALYSSTDFCCICKTTGLETSVFRLYNRNLLLCDGPCNRAFHFRCLKLKVGLPIGADFRNPMWEMKIGFAMIA